MRTIRVALEVSLQIEDDENKNVVAMQLSNKLKTLGLEISPNTAAIVTGVVVLRAWEHPK